MAQAQALAMIRGLYAIERDLRAVGADQETILARRMGASIRTAACRLNPSMSAHSGWRAAASRGIAPLRVSTYTALRLQRYFGSDAQGWLNLSDRIQKGKRRFWPAVATAAATARA